MRSGRIQRLSALAGFLKTQTRGPSCPFFLVSLPVSVSVDENDDRRRGTSFLASMLRLRVLVESTLVSRSEIKTVELVV